MPEEQSNGILESLGKANVIVLASVLVAITFAWSNLQSQQEYLAEKIASLEATINDLEGRRTEIAQLKWQQDNLQNDINRLGLQVQAASDGLRVLESRLRNRPGPEQ